MDELIPREKLGPGRRRNVTARAWIARLRPKGNFHSHVYVGGRRVEVLSTGTAEQSKALEFNRCHLLHLLKPKSAATPDPVASQGDLLQNAESIRAGREPNHQHSQAAGGLSRPCQDHESTLTRTARTSR
jgi:hypothetical protein